MPLPSKILQPPITPVFMLSVDTEEEWSWEGDFPKPPFSTKNLEKIPEFQALCAQKGIKPTYFLDYAVADNSEFCDFFQKYLDDNLCDFGAHLHPWANPPITEDICEFNSHAINIEQYLFEDKMDLLTAKLKTTFGKHPFSYRSGRWGININHLRYLSKIGYRVDSSVRPFYRGEYFSYENAPTRPYIPYLGPPDGAENLADILEIPSTSGYTNSNFELSDKIHSMLATSLLRHLRPIGILWRLGLLRQVSVTPEGNECRDVIACIDASIKRGDSVINMFIHSSNLLPGCTPFVKTEKDKIKMMDTINRCASHMQDRYGAEMVYMREIPSTLGLDE